MALLLAIENESNLPDGGPVTFAIAGKRTVDIGRDQHLDWTLPDPSRFISGKHCEVRYKDGGYWLHDVSTNGTYLNGAEERMRGPHRLRSGDRFIVGQYIIAASLDADGLNADAASSTSNFSSSKAGENVSGSHGELWGVDGAVAPPIDPKQLRSPPAAARSLSAEFLDWAASVPSAEPVNSSPADTFAQSIPQARPAEDSWWTDQPPVREYSLPPAAPSLPPSPQAPAMAASQHPAAPPHLVAERVLWNDPAREPEPVQTSPFLAPPRAEAAQRPAAPQAGSAAQPVRSTSIDSGETDDAFLRMLAAAAGLPADIFAGADHRDVAQQLGVALRCAVEGAMQLLKARNQAKQLTRSSSHTTIEATGNNPLKFSPTPEDALRIMFGGKNRGYLDAQAALAQTFDDLKSHQLKTYSALQHAVSRLVNDLDPAIIMRDFDKGKGGSLLSSKKATLWDDYRARWDMHMLPQSGGPIAAFMLHFADYYDDANDAGT